MSAQLRAANLATRLALAATLPLCWLTSAGEARAAVMGMKIDSLETHGQTVSVVTTGAEFVFDRTQNTIACRQRIPRSRPVATISGLSLSGWRVLSQNDEQCAFGNPPHGESLSLSADGLLTIAMAAGADIGITGSYCPAWLGQHGNNSFFLPDASGGVAVYLIGDGSCTKPALGKAGWTMRCRAASPARLLISVFPPRPFDWKQSAETMLHTFSCKHPYPSDEELTQWRKIGSILTLHGWIWRGPQGSTYGIERDESWATTTYVPKDEKELRRVLQTAHRIGMKVIPYMSPYYYGNPNGGATKATMPQFVDKVQTVLARYGFDGVYFDNVYSDIEGAHDLVRQVRRVMGDEKVFYVFAPNAPRLLITCPFIDTYATYTLHGEHVPQLSPQYARWIVSGYNLGNSIGTFCYDACRPNSAMVDRLLAANARLPYWVHDGTWRDRKYYLTPGETELMAAEYFPKLKKLLTSGD